MQPNLDLCSFHHSYAMSMSKGGQGDGCIVYLCLNGGNCTLNVISCCDFQRSQMAYGIHNSSQTDVCHRSSTILCVLPPDTRIRRKSHVRTTNYLTDHSLMIVANESHHLQCLGFYNRPVVTGRVGGVSTLPLFKIFTFASR